MVLFRKSKYASESIKLLEAPESFSNCNIYMVYKLFFLKEFIIYGVILSCAVFPCVFSIFCKVGLYIHIHIERRCQFFSTNLCVAFIGEIEIHVGFSQSILQKHVPSLKIMFLLAWRILLHMIRRFRIFTPTLATKAKIYILSLEGECKILANFSMI